MSSDWSVVSLDDFTARVTDAARHGSPPRVVAVDGHSSSGKTTLAAGLVGTLPAAAVLHTDDLAWHHSAFGWGDLLVAHVVAPLRAGQAVSYRPPGWVSRGRAGAVELPAQLEWLVVEGVGCSRLGLADHLDATVWVETNAALRRRRDAARVQAGEMTPEDYASWMLEETAFLAADRPWERATFVVCGNGERDGGRSRVVVAGNCRPTV